MARNYVQFNRFTTGGGSGIVLLVRARKDLMSAKEYFASFVYWTPGDVKINDILLRGYFKPQDFERFEDLNENSFLAVARKEGEILINDKMEEGYNDQQAKMIVDAAQRKEGIREILRNPFRHILVMVPFAWRGLFIEAGYSYGLTGFLVGINGALFMVLLNLFLFFSFFYQFALSIKKRHWQLFIVLIPPLYLYLINTIISHNKPRYNIPMVPFLIMSAILMILYIIDKRNSPIKKKSAKTLK
jgi:hypothetical protein